MKRLGVFGFAVLAMLLSAPAWALSPRTFVSATRGADQGPCPVQWPCLTVNYAISQTASGGEVVVSDSGSYAPFTVSKAVTVEAAPGVYAGITVSSGDGITVNVGANDAVTLRGLTINGQGGNNGITLNSAAALHVEKCVITGMANDGILANDTFAYANPATGLVFVNDTIAMTNKYAGIEVDYGKASIDRVRLENNNETGLYVEGGTVSISNSVASGNISFVGETTFGIEAYSGPGFPSEVNVENCLIANNPGAGIISTAFPGGVSTVRVSNSTVTDNGIGLSNGLSGFGPIVFSATLLSRGNNTVQGNGAPTSGTIGSFSPL